jgi:hypothetical protein
LIVSLKRISFGNSRRSRRDEKINSINSTYEKALSLCFFKLSKYASKAFKIKLLDEFKMWRPFNSKSKRKIFFWRRENDCLRKKIKE